MNISGGPEELAAFIRALNDEPVYVVEERPREVPIPLARKAPRPPAKPISDPAIFMTCLGLAFICLIVYAIFQGTI